MTSLVESFDRTSARLRKGRNSACERCGTVRPQLQRDHIVPRFLGGSDHHSNIQYLCANCHEDKTKQDIGGADLRKKGWMYVEDIDDLTGKKRLVRKSTSVATPEEYEAEVERLEAKANTMFEEASALRSEFFERFGIHPLANPAA